MIFSNLFLKLCLVSSTIGSQIPLPIYKSVNYIGSSEKKENLLNLNRSNKPQESNETSGDLSDSPLTCPGSNKEVKLCSDMYPGKEAEMKEAHRQIREKYLKEFEVQKQEDEIHDIHLRYTGQDIGPKLKESLKPLNPNYNEWMSIIPDSQLISHMSIPGTHNSAAMDWRIFVGSQLLTISEQLEYGIRFFDLSLRVNGDKFTLVYGDYNLSYSVDFNNVLMYFSSFLTKHPTEVILMRIQQDYSKASGQEVLKVWNNKRYDWARGQMYLKSVLPTIGEVRGKIVIISQIDTVPGIPYETLLVQDESEIADYSKKVDAVKTHVEKSVRTTALGYNELHLNFLSGYYAPFFPPGEVSRNILPMVADKIFGCGWPMAYGMDKANVSRKGNVHVHVGIIAMDYPNERMLYEIIKLNVNKHLMNHPVVQIVNAFSNTNLIFPSIYHWNRDSHRIVYSDQIARPTLRSTTWVQIPLSDTHYAFFNVFLHEYLWTNSRGELASGRDGRAGPEVVYELPKKNTSVLMLNTVYKTYCYEAGEGPTVDLIYVWCKPKEEKKSIWRINPV